MKPTMGYSSAVATPARLQLRNLLAGYYVSRALQVAACLDIATLLAAGPKSCEMMAQSANVHAPTLYRLLRALASFDIFVERPDGMFANTELSELLRADVAGSVRPMALFIGDEMMQVSWQALLHSVSTGLPAFDHVFGTGTFDYLSDHPLKARLFDDAMVSVSTALNPAIAEAYDFSRFGTLVDVAGGYGSTLCAILRRHPGLRGVVFDMPHVMPGARKYLEEQGMADRCDAQSGDFFHSLPAGADAYFLKHIIHDWDDERCLVILRNCHSAMSAHGRLLVSERIVPGGNERSYSKIGDLVMLVMTPGGRERTESEYRTLFEAAGFHLDRIVPTESEHSILECSKH